MTEQFSNNASSTLNGTITSSQTTLIVNSATLFPSVPQFRILVDSEIMLVTGVAGTMFTVSRGVENTVQVSHTNGATVTQILTAGAITQSKLDAVTVRTLTTVKNSPYTLSNSDDFVPFNTSGGSFTVNLPATPTSGEAHVFVDTNGSAATFPLTVNGNGNNINGTINGTGSTSFDTIGSNWGVTRYVYNGTAWTAIRNQNSLGTRVPPDANDLGVWTFQESTAPFANSGSAGADSISLISGTTNPQASGLVLPFSILSGQQAAQLSTTTSNTATDSVIEPNGAITISLWCKMLAYNASGSAQHFITKLYRPYSTWTSPFVSAEITLASNSSSTYSLVISINGVGGITTTNSLTLGEWSHIGFSWDGTTLKQYINGLAVASAAHSGTIDWGTHGPWVFGQNPANTPEGNFVGYMQDVRIANIARSASWFRTVYRAGVGLSLP